MARYYRRRYYRKFPRRYFKRYIRRRVRRYINGSSKSTVRVKIPISATFSMQTDANGAVKGGPITPWARDDSPFSAITSPLYRLYTQLYDEVKCIGGRIIISIGTPIGTSSVPSLTVITAWDRRYSVNTQEDPVPTFDQLSNYSTMQKAVAVNNSIAKLKRSCYASDLLEKAQWHDSELVTYVESGTTYTRDNAYFSNPSNPNFFVPAMWLGASITNATAQTITFQADITWYFSFRNPKYGASASSNKGMDATTLDTEEQDIFDMMDATPEMHTGGGKVERKTLEPVTAVGFDNGRAKRVRVTQPKNVL